MFEPDRYMKRDIASFLQSRLCVQGDSKSPEEARKVGYVDAIAGPDLILTGLVADAVEEEASRQITRAYRHDVGWRRARLDYKSLRNAVGCGEVAMAAAHSAGFFHVVVGARGYWINFTDQDRSLREAVATAITTVTFDGLVWDVDGFVQTCDD